MIVWGGYNGSIGWLNTGGRYNPSTDSWTANQHYQCARWPRGAHGSVDRQ